MHAVKEYIQQNYDTEILEQLTTELEVNVWITGGQIRRHLLSTQEPTADIDLNIVANSVKWESIQRFLSEFATTVLERDFRHFKMIHRDCVIYDIKRLDPDENESDVVRRNHEYFDCTLNAADFLWSDPNIVVSHANFYRDIMKRQIRIVSKPEYIQKPELFLLRVVRLAISESLSLRVCPTLRAIISSVQNRDFVIKGLQILKENLIQNTSHLKDLVQNIELLVQK